MMFPKMFTRNMARNVSAVMKENKVENHQKENKLKVKCNADDYAYIEYNKVGEVYDLVHTKIPDEYKGHGLGSILAEKVFNYIIENNSKMKLTCEYLQHYYNKNVEKFKDHVVNN